MPTSEPEVLDLARLTDEGYAALYAERLEPLLAAREAERRKRVSDFWFHVLLAIPIGIVGACAAWYFTKDPEPTGLIGLSCAAVTIVIALIPLDSLRKAVKLELVETIAAAIGVRYRERMFEVPPGFDRCRALDLAPGHDRASFEDFFHGEREGCAFDLYEANLEVQRRGRNGNTYYQSVFRGQIIRIAFPKAFHGVTIVRRDAGLFNGLQGGDYKRVGLADPHFERLFEVYSNDQVEARALVHPVFMERLMEIERAFKGGKVRCAFEGGRLLVMVEGPDRFEPGSMFTPLTDPKRPRKIIDDIAMVLRLMDAVLTAELAPLVARRLASES